MLPDSRMPRRLPMLMSTMNRTPSSTPMGASAGIADSSCSTADEIDTATVST